MSLTHTKRANAGERSVYRLLEKMAPNYNDQFQALQLPTAIQIDDEKEQVTLPYYSGQKFNDKWHESNGGAPFCSSLISNEVALTISDLCLIDTAPACELISDQGIKKAAFDYGEWQEEFDHHIMHLVNSGYLCPNEIELAKSILDEPPNSPMIMSNGDFYPRNFILCGKRLVLIDWQTWDKDYRVNLIDYRDNIVAFIFIHMWGNRRWQIKFLQNIQLQFQMELRSFQKALLIKAFSQAWFWKDQPKLCVPQVGIFRDALSIHFVEAILSV